MVTTRELDEARMTDSYRVSTRAPQSGAVGFASLTLVAVSAGAIALLVVGLRNARREFNRQLATRDEKRRRMVDEIAKLRGARVRVGAEEPAAAAAPELDESAAGEGTRSGLSM